MRKNKESVEHKPSKTAFLTCFIRAISSREFKGDIWGSDYLAEKFMVSLDHYNHSLENPLSKQFLKKKTPGMYEYIIARTVYFDSIFKQALKENYPQIVILGAGYDTRAHRFKDLINETMIFELDIHSTQQHKEKLLLEAGIHVHDHLILAPINFNTESLKEVLFKAGFDKDRKTLFLWEGVTYYLTPKAINTTLDFIKLNSPSNSTVAFDYVCTSPNILSKYGVMKLIKFMRSENPGEPRRFIIGEGKIGSFLTERGFKIIEHITPKDLEKKILTANDGSLLGQVVAWFYIIQASVK